MSSFANSLAQIQAQCKGNYFLTKDDRALIHQAYWNGNEMDISSVLEIMCFDPDVSDVPILLDASSPGSLWVHRCDAAQALGGLGDEGARILQLMQVRETHPIVQFYVLRELIDLGDSSVELFLASPIPPTSSPNRRSLWIFGNYNRGSISREKALRFLARITPDSNDRHDWLRDHINAI
jgi:hypothetical protein